MRKLLKSKNTSAIYELLLLIAQEYFIILFLEPFSWRRKCEGVRFAFSSSTYHRCCKRDFQNISNRNMLEEQTKLISCSFKEFSTFTTYWYLELEFEYRWVLFNSFTLLTFFICNFSRAHLFTSSANFNFPNELREKKQGKVSFIL